MKNNSRDKFDSAAKNSDSDDALERVPYSYDQGRYQGPHEDEGRDATSEDGPRSSRKDFDTARERQTAEELEADFRRRVAKRIRARKAKARNRPDRYRGFERER